MQPQTLQTARLTSKPLPLPQFFTNSIADRLRDAPPLRPPPKAPGILRQRVQPKNIAPVEPIVETNPRACEVIAKFCASQGLSLNCVNNHAFKDFIRYLDPEATLPTEGELRKTMEKLSTSTKITVNYNKTVGPLTVTIDVAGSDDEKYLVFSIHYFEDLLERKNVIYIRKLLLSDFDPDSFLNSIRRTINYNNYHDVKFSNLVCPSDEIYGLLVNTPVVKRVYMCAFQYITKFVLDLLDIGEFSGGLQEIRDFVSFVREDLNQFSKVRRIQMSRGGGELDIPSIDESTWCNTALFLTRCLYFHDVFTEFVDRHRYGNYISSHTFNHLIYLQRLMQQCVKYCRELSKPNSSISQVIYVYSGLKSFITANSMGYRFQTTIRQSVDTAFQDLSCPQYERRYNIATYLDPRYAYRDSIYSSPKWKMIEEWVVQDFINYDEALKKSYSFDLDGYSKDELRELVRQEVVHYRTVSFVERPDETDCPFNWWGSRQLHFAILSVMSREYLACPAVSVEARQYFSDGGKFEHLMSQYTTDQLQPMLTVAGFSQKFLGRGASENKITPKMQETLNSTANRLQKEVHFDLYTHHLAATEEERDAILTADYPPMPMAASNNRPYIPLNQRDKNPEPERMTVVPPRPLTLPIRQVPPHRSSGRPIHLNGVELKAIPIRQVTTQSKVPSVPPHRVNNRNNVPILPDGVVNLTTGLIIPGKIVEADSVEEQKPKIVSEKEIKEEIIEPDMEKVKEEPLEEDAPVSTQPTETKPALVEPSRLASQTVPTKTPPMLFPVRTVSQFSRSPAAPMIPKIQPHNFVQKFVGKQNFVPKFPVKIISPLPPPISIRAPIPKIPSLLGSRVIQPLKLPKNEEIQPEQKPKVWGQANNESRDEHKPDVLDDFDPDRDFDSILDPPGTIYSDILNETTAHQAMERHRVTMEFHKRKPCNRRCAVCGHLELHDLLKNVTIENEKLLIMLGCVYRGEFTLAHAREFMARETKTYICRVHFGETLDEIDQMLKLSDRDDVFSASADAIKNVMLTARQLRPHITVPALRNMLNDFVERNNHLRRNKGNYDENFDDFSPYIIKNTEPETNDVDDDAIIPKVFRQPRKQVLEADQHKGVVRVIEQDEFKLPVAVEPAENQEIVNPALCCFCSVRGERSLMLKVPRGEDRLAKWVEKLGEEFEKRIKKDEEHLICRSHFPVDAFSSRGRLLKGMIPDTSAEKVVVTYRIQGSDFLKLKEKRTGTEKTASVNLDNNPSATTNSSLYDQYTDSDSDDEPAPKEVNKSGKPRGRPKGSTKKSKGTTPKTVSVKRSSRQQSQLSEEEEDYFHYETVYDDYYPMQQNNSVFHEDALLTQEDTKYIPQPRPYAPKTSQPVRKSAQFEAEYDFIKEEEIDYELKPDISALTKTHEHYWTDKNESMSYEAEDSGLTKGDSDYVPKYSSSITGVSGRKRGRPRKVCGMSQEPEEDLLAPGDTDYVPSPTNSIADTSVRKRGRPRKYTRSDDEEEEDTTSRRSSVAGTATVRRQYKRKSEEDAEDYDEQFKKEKAKRGRYNVRIGGKFVKLDALSSYVEK